MIKGNQTRLVGTSLIGGIHTKVAGGLRKKGTFAALMKKLFANGEEGFWYDPDDLSTMYQDAAGTVPVTAAGQAVGLMLDKSKLKGKNLIANGSFQNGSSNWVLTGTAELTPEGVSIIGGGSSGSISQTIPTVASKTYLVSARLSNIIGNGLASTIGVAARFYGAQVFTASSAETAISFRGFGAMGSNNSGTITEIVVQEVPGNRAYQTTSAARPILRKNVVTGANYLEFDGADDHLIIGSLPSILDISIACAVRPRQSKTNPVLGRGAAGYLYVTATSQILQGAASVSMTNLNKAEAVIATSTRVGDVLKTKVRNKTNINLLDKESATSGGYANANNIAIGAFNATGNTPGAIDLYGIIAVNKIISESDEDTLLAHYNKLAGA